MFVVGRSLKESFFAERIETVRNSLEIGVGLLTK